MNVNRMALRLEGRVSTLEGKAKQLDGNMEGVDP
jgi:hypothetical protein